MTYKELITFCKPISVRGDTPGSLGALCQDSRMVKPGDIFIAVKGTQTDGHDYISDAVKNGASLLIVDKEVNLSTKTALIKVDDTRELLSRLALKLAGNPDKKLKIIGITGTNGKTTVATLVWQILRRMDKRAALLGTVSKRINDKEFPSRLTTADPIELASDLKEISEAECEYLVMEVSSHALHQKRVGGILFDVAAFTNLSHDHLDYHKSMDEYAAAKKILFDNLAESAIAVINADDLYGSYMVKDTSAKVLDFSFKNGAVISVSIDRLTPYETVLDLEGVKIHTPLIGRFNAANVTQSVLICYALGFSSDVVADHVPYCTGAAGRMEKVVTDGFSDDKPLVIVDYAHTPDALKNVASTLSELKKPEQNLVILFGCGGDRDKGKRPEMARIAAKYGDKIIVTSDNPRSEDPAMIIKDIVAGFSSVNLFETVVSRREAIRKAIRESDVNSLVLIAGKGHETYQEIKGERTHFDDREEARKALSNQNGPLKNSEVN
jgi:UDP-N-acetylmuramoyl-L-alanyl-D-glutamate--2,6-diaminopimelate ligase